MRNTNRENDLQRESRFHVEFQSALELLGIPLLEQPGYLRRLQRTGLCEEISGSYYDYTGGSFRTNPQYHRLRLALGGPTPRIRLLDVNVSVTERFVSASEFKIKGTVHVSTRMPIRRFGLAVELLTRADDLTMLGTKEAIVVPAPEVGQAFKPGHHSFEVSFFPLPVSGHERTRLRVTFADPIDTASLD